MEEKVIKFRPALIALVLSGSKRSTWRLFDEKGLSVGDRIACVDFVSGETVARGVITGCETQVFEEMLVLDDAMHETYATYDAMEKVFREYYGDRVERSTPVKVLTFRLDGDA